MNVFSEIGRSQYYEYVSTYLNFTTVPVDHKSHAWICAKPPFVYLKKRKIQLTLGHAWEVMVKASVFNGCGSSMV